jgi:hypothetical protein
MPHNIPFINPFGTRINPFSRDFLEAMVEIAEATSAFQFLQNDIENAIEAAEYFRRSGGGETRYLPAIITSNVSIGDNRWQYAWSASRVTDVGDLEVNPEGPDSTTAPYQMAWNKAETLNTSASAGHGVVLNPSGATGIVLPIPTGTPVDLFLQGTMGEPVLLVHYFSEVNAINFACTP